MERYQETKQDFLCKGYSQEEGIDYGEIFSPVQDLKVLELY